MVPSNGEVMRKRRQEEADLAEFHQQKKAKEDFKQRSISGTSEGKTIAKLPMKISGYPTAYPLIWISMIVLMNMYLGSKY